MAVKRNVRKDFIMRLYDPATDELVDTFHSKEFSDELNYSIAINGGLSPMILRTNLGFKEWTQEGGRLKKLVEGQKAKFFVIDKESPKAGIQVYSGIFSGFSIKLSGESDVIALNFLPNTIFLAKRVLRDELGENTTVSYLSQEPADIIKSIVYRADTDIGYAPETMLDTGLSRSYTFNVSTSLQAIKKIIDLLPTGWFFYVGGDDRIYLRNHESGEPTFTYWGEFTWGTDYWKFDPATNETIIHNINYMNQVKEFLIDTEMSNMVNRVFFLGGGDPQLYKYYQNETSQNIYGLYEEPLADERVTDPDTAESFSHRILDNFNVPLTRLTVEILDSNFSDKGYDIEDFSVGDKIRIDGNLADNVYFGVPFFIKKIYYKFHSAIVEMELQPEGVSARVEDINRDLTNFRFNTAPAVPDNL